MSGKKEIRYVVRYSPYVKNYATVKKLSMRQFLRSAPVPRQDFFDGLIESKKFLAVTLIAYRRVAYLGIY